MVVPFSSDVLGSTPDTYQPAGLERGTATSKSTTTGTTSRSRRGSTPKVVSERLGHASIAITLDLYSHVTPSMQSDAAEKLGAVIFGDT